MLRIPLGAAGDVLPGGDSPATPASATPTTSPRRLYLTSDDATGVPHRARIYCPA
jgi:hypothetical protein